MKARNRVRGLAAPYRSKGSSCSCQRVQMPWQTFRFCQRFMASAQDKRMYHTAAAVCCNCKAQPQRLSFTGSSHTPAQPLATGTSSPAGTLLCHTPHRRTSAHSLALARHCTSASLHLRDVLERPYTVGGVGFNPPPPPPPLLPMYKADSQNLASAPSAPRGFELKNFRPA